jgi:RimJ/RimL family protein N-acetyltransferase
MPDLHTDRLLLLRWRVSDRGPFARLNADPRVMEYFPAALMPAESDTMIGRIEAHFERYGYGLWALELRDTGEFIGFTGLNVPTFKTHFTPCVEIGWRLAFDHWGRGLATEAARSVLHHAFATLGLKEVVSFTAAVNLRSRCVMEKLGMTHNPSDDFDHPRLPAGHPLLRHVLYRLRASSL